MVLRFFSFCKTSPTQALRLMLHFMLSSYQDNVSICHSPSLLPRRAGRLQRFLHCRKRQTTHQPSRREAELDPTPPADLSRPPPDRAGALQPRTNPRADSLCRNRSIRRCDRTIAHLPTLARQPIQRHTRTTLLYSMFRNDRQFHSCSTPTFRWWVEVSSFDFAKIQILRTRYPCYAGP